jgi:carboxymethylenebutenolidase
MCHERVTWPVSGGSPSAVERASLDRDGTQLPLYVARPSGNEKEAGVVVIHDVHGANDFYKDFTARLADEGYLAALPDLFVRQGEGANGSREAIMARANKLDLDVALEDIVATVRHVRDLRGAEGPVGLIGFCMGGTLAMLSASLVGGPDAAVSFYGFPAGRASWPKKPLDVADTVRVPLLMIVGDQDTGVGMDNMEKYEAALDAANKDYESITYPGVGHGFMTFDPNAETYPQASDAWTAMLQFLDQQLTHD